MFSVFNRKFPTFIRLPQVFRYAKFVQKSKEELREELDNTRFKIVRDSITSAMKQKKCLSVPEWKSLTAQLKKHHLLSLRGGVFNQLVFSVLLSLPPPNDSVSNARSFVKAANLTFDLNVKRRFIELYAKKHAEVKLTEEEEKEIIEMLVLLISKIMIEIPSNYIDLFLLFCSLQM